MSEYVPPAPWFCRQCGQSNDAYATTCGRCEDDKPSYREAMWRELVGLYTRWASYGWLSVEDRERVKGLRAALGLEEDK